MDIKTLKAFCEVCRSKEFTRAATVLGLTQSAVSQQVKSLERELCVLLFDEKDRTSPTPAGEYLYREASALLAKVEDIKNGVKWAGSETGGNVRFGMIDVVAENVMPQVITSFKKRYPEVKLEAVVKTTGELIKMVRMNELDFAVFVTNDLPAGFSSVDLYRDSIVAVKKRGASDSKTAISIKDLRGEPLILYPQGSRTRQVIEDAFKKAGVVPAVSMEIHYPAAIISLVKQGMGTALISALSAAERRQKGVCEVKVKELSGIRVIGAAFLQGRGLSPQAKRLVDEACKKIKKHKV